MLDSDIGSRSATLHFISMSVLMRAAATLDNAGTGERLPLAIAAMPK
jgi:hypothetical protein